LTLTIAALLVGVVAIGIIAGKIAECSGPDVGKRFLEVTPDYTADGFRNWVMCYPSQARRYAFPTAGSLCCMPRHYDGHTLGPVIADLESSQALRCGAPHPARTCRRRASVNSR
jgi:hypothetical protein